MPIQIPRGFDIAVGPTQQLARAAQFLKPKPTKLLDVASGLGELSGAILRIGAEVSAKQQKEQESADLIAATTEAANLSRDFTRPADSFQETTEEDERAYAKQMQTLIKTHGRTDESQRRIAEMITGRTIDALDRAATRTYNLERTKRVVSSERAFNIELAARDWHATADQIKLAEEAGFPRELVSRMRTQQREGKIREGFEQSLGPDGTNYEKAAQFVIDVGKNPALTDAQQSALSSSLRGELDRLQALEKTRDETETARLESLDILTTGNVQRQIERGDPITDMQLHAMHENGAFGDVGTQVAARRLDGLKDAVAKADATRMDVARLQDPNSLERPAPTSKRTGDASDRMLNTNVQSGQSLSDAAVSVAAQSGRVPPRVEALVESQWRARETMDEALRMYSDIVDKTPAAYWALDTDTQAAMEMGYRLLSSYPPEQRDAQLNYVAGLVYDATVDIDRSVLEARKENWKTIEKTSLKQLSDLVGEKGFETLGIVIDWWPDPAPALIPPNMNAQFLANAEASYLATGDSQTAWRAGARRVAQNWVATGINKDVRDLRGDTIGYEYQWQGIPDQNVDMARGKLATYLTQISGFFDRSGDEIINLDTRQIEIRAFEPPRFSDDPQYKGVPLFRLMYQGAPLMVRRDPDRDFLVPLRWRAMNDGY